jgi:hypothetical protein
MEKDNRLKELVHYICYKCQEPNKLGAVKLNKILWFADKITYKQTGKSISGSQYRKLQFGPVPVLIKSILDDLESENKLLIEKHEYYGSYKTKFIALENPKESIFSGEELALVDCLISEICDDHTAESISNLSHDMVWEAGCMGEEIPLTAVLITDEAILNEKDIAWANDVIDRLKEGVAA